MAEAVRGLPDTKAPDPLYEEAEGRVAPLHLRPRRGARQETACRSCRRRPRSGRRPRVYGAGSRAAWSPGRSRAPCAPVERRGAAAQASSGSSYSRPSRTDLCGTQTKIVSGVERLGQQGFERRLQHPDAAGKRGQADEDRRLAHERIRRAARSRSRDARASRRSRGRSGRYADALAPGVLGS